MNLDGLDKAVLFGSHFKDTEMSLAKDIVFVNHGSYGSVPKRVAAVRRRYQEEMENNADRWFRGAAFEHWENAIDVISPFFHCHSQDLVLVSNATTAINSVLVSYKLKAGDAILTTKLTYAAVQTATEYLTSITPEAETIVVDVTFPITTPEQIVKQYEECLKSHPNIRIAIIDYITSPSCVVLPVKELIDLCQRYNVLSVIDAAHAPGQIPLHLDDLNADIFAGNLHKWMYAPRGCAFLWVNPKHKDWLHPLVTSWGMGHSLHTQFFMQGTRDHTSEICSMHALQFYKAIGGMDRILDYTTKLISEAQEYLVKLLDTQSLAIPKSMEAPNMRCILLSGVCGFQQSYVFTTSEQMILDVMNKSKVVCAFVCIEGRLYARISSNVYNTMDDYKRLGEVLTTMMQH